MATKTKAANRVYVAATRAKQASKGLVRAEVVIPKERRGELQQIAWTWREAKEQEIKPA